MPLLLLSRTGEFNVTLCVMVVLALYMAGSEMAQILMGIMSWIGNKLL
jgi:hypothetical protein